MMEREVISGRQLTMLIFTFITATGTLFVPSIVTQAAGHDGWISVLIGGIEGILTAIIVAFLGVRYPGKSLIEYSEIILSRWPGKILGLVYILFYLHITSILVREVSSTIQGTLLQNSPIEMITLIIFLATAYSVKMGLETITRANSLNLFVTYIAIFLVLFLILKDMNFKMLTPVLSNGYAAVLKGSLTPAAWMGEVVGIAFIIPFLNKPKEAGRCAVFAVVWAAMTLSVMAALVVTVFGPQLSALLSFSTLEAVRYINVGQYIQRIEIVFLIPWIISNYIKISFFYYISVLIISVWFNTEKVKTLVIPIGLLIFSLSLSLFRNSVDLSIFLTKVWGYYSLPFEFGIPLLLLIIELFRKKGRQKIDNKI